MEALVELTWNDPREIGPRKHNQIHTLGILH